MHGGKVQIDCTPTLKKTNRLDYDGKSRIFCFFRAYLRWKAWSSNLKPLRTVDVLLTPLFVPLAVSQPLSFPPLLINLILGCLSLFLALAILAALPINLILGFLASRNDA